MAQNGLPMPGSVQSFIGPQWGHVKSFALPAAPDGLPIDPGSAPKLDDPRTTEAFKRAAIEVLRL